MPKRKRSRPQEEPRPVAQILAEELARRGGVITPRDDSREHEKMLARRAIDTLKHLFHKIPDSLDYCRTYDQSTLDLSLFTNAGLNLSDIRYKSNEQNGCYNQCRTLADFKREALKATKSEHFTPDGNYPEAEVDLSSIQYREIEKHYQAILSAGSPVLLGR